MEWRQLPGVVKTCDERLQSIHQKADPTAGGKQEVYLFFANHLYSCPDS